MWETWVQFLGQEVPLEKEMATHSSILAWRIPWTEEPDRRDRKSRTQLNAIFLSFLFLWEDEVGSCLQCLPHRGVPFNTRAGDCPQWPPGYLSLSFPTCNKETVTPCPAGRCEDYWEHASKLSGS